MDQRKLFVQQSKLCNDTINLKIQLLNNNLHTNMHQRSHQFLHLHTSARLYTKNLKINGHITIDRYECARARLNRPSGLNMAAHRRATHAHLKDGFHVEISLFGDLYVCVYVAGVCGWTKNAVGCSRKNLSKINMIFWLVRVGNIN